jgi:hypothetical protein
MTKALHNGLGRIQRMILHDLAEAKTALDATQLTAKAYSVDPAPDADGQWNMTEAQCSAVRRALKALQRAGKVGIVGHNRQRRTLWVTAERLVKAIAAHEISCALCGENLRDQEFAYVLDDDQYVHKHCWHQQQQNNGIPPHLRKPPCDDQYQNKIRMLNGMSNERP